MYPNTNGVDSHYPEESMKITAAQALKLVNESLTPKMDRFYREIFKQAKAGYRGACIALSGNEDQMIDKIIDELKRQGFDAKRDRHMDYRDSWDNLKISW